MLAAENDSGGGNCGGDHQRSAFVGPSRADWIDRTRQTSGLRGVRGGGLSGNSLLFWCEYLLDDDEARGDCVFAGVRRSASKNKRKDNAETQSAQRNAESWKRNRSKDRPLQSQERQDRGIATGI